MQIKLKNLGILKQAEFSLGDITIICGDNNTGKTYATYALFGFLTFWREAFTIGLVQSEIKRLLADGVIRIDIGSYIKNAAQIVADGCLAYAKQLPRVFAAQEDRFQDAEFLVVFDQKEIHASSVYSRTIRAANAELFSITKGENHEELVITLLMEKEKAKIPRDIIKKIIGDALKEIIFSRLFPNPVIACTERTGAVIFRRELNLSRNRILEEMGKLAKNIPMELSSMEFLSKFYREYAWPVKTNVEFTSQLEAIAKKNSFIKEKHPDVLEDFADIIGGQYAVTKNDELYYVPKGKRVRLSMDESSSAVRSLLDIGFYLKHVAQVGDLFIVDEPELNLHPKNQCRMARLFARLANLGIKVFITTHSDYIIKELNTLIMLNHDKPHLKQIAAKEGYKLEELISSDKIKVYIAEESLIKLDGGQNKTKCQTLTLANIDPELGIEARSFDETIETMNRIQEEIVWGGE